MENQAPRWREGLKGESPAVQKEGIAPGLLHLGPAAVVGRVHLGKIEVDSVPTIVNGDVEGNSVDITSKMNSFATIQLRLAAYGCKVELSYCFRLRCTRFTVSPLAVVPYGWPFVGVQDCESFA